MRVLPMEVELQSLIYSLMAVAFGKNGQNGRDPIPQGSRFLDQITPFSLSLSFFPLPS